MYVLILCNIPTSVTTKELSSVFHIYDGHDKNIAAERYDIF
jgi:hypothetical protein